MTITIDEFVDREIIYCASVLISDLARIVPEVPYPALKDTSIDDDELRNLMQHDDWENPTAAYIDSMHRDDLIDALEEYDVEDDRDAAVIAAAFEDAKKAPDFDPDTAVEFWHGVPDKKLRTTLLGHLTRQEELEDFAREHNLDPEVNEVYEHWIVTNWLANRLREKGEVVGEVAGLTIWGRCTTGQSISMDWVIQQIYKDLTGQEADQ